MGTGMADLFKRISLGVYVVGVADGARKSAFTAAWVMQASFDPLLLVVSVNPRSASHAVLESGQVFSVNVLARQQIDLAHHFGMPGAGDKLAGVAWREGLTGCPLLDEAVAWFECEVTAHHPAGDHVLIVGRVVDGKLAKPELEPLTYQDTGNMDGAERLFPAGFIRSVG